MLGGVVWFEMFGFSFLSLLLDVPLLFTSLLGFSPSTEVDCDAGANGFDFPGT